MPVASPSASVKAMPLLGLPARFVTEQVVERDVVGRQRGVRDRDARDGDRAEAAQRDAVRDGDRLGRHRIVDRSARNAARGRAVDEDHVAVARGRQRVGDRIEGADQRSVADREVTALRLAAEELHGTIDRQDRIVAGGRIRGTVLEAELLDAGQRVGAVAVGGVVLDLAESGDEAGGAVGGDSDVVLADEALIDRGVGAESAVDRVVEIAAVELAVAGAIGDVRAQVESDGLGVGQALMVRDRDRDLAIIGVEAEARCRCSAYFTCSRMTSSSAGEIQLGPLPVIVSGMVLPLPDTVSPSAVSEDANPLSRPSDSPLSSAVSVGFEFASR